MFAPWFRSVQDIAHDGAANMRQLGANLVKTARSGAQFEQGARASTGQCGIKKFGQLPVAPSMLSYGRFFACFIFGEPIFQMALQRLGLSLRHSMVDFLRFALLELQHQVGERSLGFGHEQDTARGAVEAVRQAQKRGGFEPFGRRVLL